MSHVRDVDDSSFFLQLVYRHIWQLWEWFTRPIYGGIVWFICALPTLLHGIFIHACMYIIYIYIYIHIYIYIYIYIHIHLIQPEDVCVFFRDISRSGWTFIGCACFLLMGSFLEIYGMLLGGICMVQYGIIISAWDDMYPPPPLSTEDHEHAWDMYLDIPSH